VLVLALTAHREYGVVANGGWMAFCRPAPPEDLRPGAAAIPVLAATLRRVSLVHNSVRQEGAHG
jgi:hypothetical protein